MNSDYLELLAHLVNNEEKYIKLVISKRKTSEKDSSEKSYFSPLLQRKLKAVLNNSKGSNNLSKSEKIKIQEQLDNLSSKEYEWKSKQRIMFNPVLANNMFPNSYAKFKNAFYSRFSLTTNQIKSQRANTLVWKTKYKGVIKGFSTLMINLDMKVFAEVLEISDEGFEIIFKEYFNIHWVFYDLIRLLYKQSHENLFNSTNLTNLDIFDGKVADTVLVVKRHQIVYKFAEILLLHLVNIVFLYLQDIKNKKYDTESIHTQVRITLSKKQMLFNKKKEGKDTSFWWGKHIDNIYGILKCLEESSFFEHTVKDISRDNSKGSFKKLNKEIQYVLPVAISESAISFTELPRIVKPGRITLQNLDSIIKPIVFGEGVVTKSDRLLKTLHITQTKCFKTNILYYLLINYFFEILPDTKLNKYLLSLVKNKSIKLPFKDQQSQANIGANREVLEDIPINSTLNGYLRDLLRKSFVGSEINNHNLIQLKKITGWTPLEIAIGKTKHQSNVERETLKLQRMHARTLLYLAEAYIGFPVYITETLCARLRLYPAQPLIARTSGMYKHLLTEWSENRLTIRGFINLLVCYYVVDKKKLLEFKKFLAQQKLSKKKGFSLLYSYFENNPLDFSKVKNILYFSYIHMEILKLNLPYRDKKTSISLEIDQNASGVTLLAYLTRNRQLAKVCGVLGPTESSAYEYCMVNFESYYNDKFEFKNDKALQLLTTNRKLHKYALMCFSYSQTRVGRAEDFLTVWNDTFAEAPNPEERQTLIEFADKYEDFLNTLFPGFAAQIQVLLKAVELSVQNRGDITVRTLEGEVLTWRFFKHSVKTRTIIDPFTRKGTDVKHKVYMYEPVDTNADVTTVEEVDTRRGGLIPDIRLTKKNFLSYIIHSLDAAIMRRLIRVMYEKHNCKINHLHDCVILHPNFIDAFYEEIRLLYESDEMYNIVNDLFFDQVRSTLDTKAQIKLDSIRDKFLKGSDNFRSEINIDPLVLYSPET